MSATQDRVPVVATIVTAATSMGLLALAVHLGWLGDDVGRGAEYCEAARDGWLKQPANALSNLGFVVAGLAIGWRSRRPDSLGETLPGFPGLAAGYGCLVVLLGPASAAMHATQSSLGGLLDVTSMYLVASFAAAYAVTRRRRGGSTSFWSTFVVLVVACELVGLYDRDIAVVHSAGNVAFALLLVVAVVVEVLLWRDGPPRTDLRFGGAALASMVVAFAIWNLSQHGWCDPDSLLQGHAVWHLLGALAAYLLFCLYASEKSAAPRRRRRAGRGRR